MQDEYKAKRLREMLETTESTGFCAKVRHELNPAAGILSLDADALRVLIAHYELRQIKPARPAWLDPEPFDMPAAPRRLPEELRE